MATPEVVIIDGRKNPHNKLHTNKARMQRFWSYVNKSKGLGPKGKCWEWEGAIVEAGYGHFAPGLDLCNEKIVSRISWKLAHPLLSIRNKLVCHKCDNRRCVRPSHLFRGSKQDNANDMKAKGRGRGLVGSAHHKAKLCEADIFRILSLRKKNPVKWTYAALGLKFRVSFSMIGFIIRGENWTHVK